MPQSVTVDTISQVGGEVLIKNDKCHKEYCLKFDITRKLLRCEFCKSDEIRNKILECDYVFSIDFIKSL